MDRTEPGALTGGVAPTLTQVESPQVTALVERAKSGDAEAFDGLMRLYERRIIAIGVQMGLSRSDSLDACQDTFLKVFRYIARFRTGEAFYRWLYRIAINVIYDHLRWSRPAGVVSVEEITVAQASRLRDAAIPLEKRVESADLVRKLLAGVTTLSRQERIVFILRDLQGMTTEEIGRILGLSRVTVRRHCMSARHRLKDRLFPKGIERQERQGGT